MAIFGPKAWVNPLGKMSIWRLFGLLVFIGQKGVFSFQNIVKDIISGLYCLKKTNLEKWPFLDENSWGNSLGKMSNFRLFGLLVFIAQKGVFSFQNIIKDIFQGLYCLKKTNLEKWPFLDQNSWVNPLGKMSIFRHFGLLVFIA